MKGLRLKLYLLNPMSNPTIDEGEGFYLLPHWFTFLNPSDLPGQRGFTFYFLCFCLVSYHHIPGGPK